MVRAVELDALAPWAALIGALVFFLWLDLHFFARGREPSFKEAAWWSVGWLVVSHAFTLWSGRWNSMPWHRGQRSSPP